MTTERMSIPADWTFQSREVASHFDQHVREQLPWYDLITNAIVVIARHYLESGALVYDIGCSTGNITRAIHQAVSARRVRFVGIDNSPDMRDFYRCGDFGKFELADACSYSFQPFDLAVCYLFFQFIPLESRRPLLLNLIGRVKRSGAIILVDKMFPPEQSRHTPDIFRRITLSAKRDNGAPPDEILSKELSLGGVQRPVSLDCITEASPLAYEFFRFGEFSG